jgi:hypothetical protein
MSREATDRAEQLDISSARVAEFRELSKLAGLPLSESITEAILQALAAGVTPTGAYTRVSVSGQIMLSWQPFNASHQRDCAMMSIHDSQVVRMLVQA